MTRIENNGGPDFFVGASSEEKPTVENDGVSEGATVYETDTKTMKILNGSGTWDTMFRFT